MRIDTVSYPSDAPTSWYDNNTGYISHIGDAHQDFFYERGIFCLRETTIEADVREEHR